MGAWGQVFYPLFIRVEGGLAKCHGDVAPSRPQNSEGGLSPQRAEGRAQAEGRARGQEKREILIDQIDNGRG